MISLDLDAMEAAAQRLLTAHGLTVDGTGDNDRVISPAITSARDVLALAAALRTERAAREAAEAQHAALAAAVRAYLAAVDAHRAEKTRWQREYIPAEGVQRARIAEALAVVGTKRTALDAALATTTTTPKESR